MKPQRGLNNNCPNYKKKQKKWSVLLVVVKSRQHANRLLRLSFLFTYNSCKKLLKLVIFHTFSYWLLAVCTYVWRAVFTRLRAESSILSRIERAQAVLPCDRRNLTITGGHFTLTVSLSTQVYKWVPANVRWRTQFNTAMDKHLIQGGEGGRTPVRFVLQTPVVWST